MVHYVKIADGSVDIELSDLLGKFDGSRYFWAILFLEATGNIGEDKSVPELEEEIAGSERGWRMSWEDLTVFSKQLHQTIDIVLIGCKEEHGIQRFDDDKDMYAACDIVVERVDSSYWLIHSKEKSIADRVRSLLADPAQ